MTHLLHIVGCKNSGKTRLIEFLAPLLGESLGTVGTVKYAERNHFRWEREGTDTDRHFRSGSLVTAILGEDVFALESRAALPTITLPNVLRVHYAGIALALTEGFVGATGLKIEVQRDGYTDRDTVTDAECLATYGDSVRARPCPHFDYGTEKSLSDYIVANRDRLARVD